jgi:FtsZ-binding cell division protein ZapB
MNIANSLAFSNEKINNFLNNFYLKLDKINPQIQKKIDKLKLIKAKIEYVRITKKNLLSDDTKNALKMIEKNLGNKINVYKNMLSGSFE